MISRIENYFLKLQKAQSVREKIGELDQQQSKYSILYKRKPQTTIKHHKQWKTNPQPQWGYSLCIEETNNSYSEYRKNYSSKKKSPNSPIEKLAKEANRQFPEEKNWMANM